MSRFIMVFLSVFIGVHALFFLRIRVLFMDKWGIQWLVILGMTLMVFVPIASYMLERNDHDLLARCMAFLGFSWMGLIFIAFSISFLMTVYDGIIWIINTVTPADLPSLYGKTQALVMIGLIVIISLYGIYEARQICVEPVRIETDKLPEGTDMLKIAQISDIHLGLIIREGFLKKIVEKIESIKPDILVCTGDYVDSSLRNMNYLTEYINKIDIRYGKYAVTGNHESFARLDHALAFFKKSGFTVLRGETTTLGNIINIAGVDDSRSREMAGGTDHTRVLDALPEKDNGLFTVLLKHRPDIKAESLGRFDLQLSGHTHKGQIFPFYFIVKYPFPLIAGLYKLGKGSLLYVNRGTGTWGPPMRILAPPEITLIELVRKTY